MTLKLPQSTTALLVHVYMHFQKWLKRYQWASTRCFHPPHCQAYPISKLRESAKFRTPEKFLMILVDNKAGLKLECPITELPCKHVSTSLNIVDLLSVFRVATSEKNPQNAIITGRLWSINSTSPVKKNQFIQANKLTSSISEGLKIVKLTFEPWVQVYRDGS
jgi:hypothetical protein